MDGVPSKPCKSRGCDVDLTGCVCRPFGLRRLSGIRCEGENWRCTKAYSSDEKVTSALRSSGKLLALVDAVYSRFAQLEKAGGEVLGRGGGIVVKRC